ncbi:hypothetical protein F4781DRAFT_374802 [Annulohypoxylon bovei var. microspora]|nr:hypothetical protein F4781DRAFT_374802 [Annulohypoxylon bovei var. microspora]
MAEVQARSQAPSSRGRGGGRGGRGGFSSRGSANRRINGDKFNTTDATSLDDDGDVSQLRKQYGVKLDTIKELFPTWSDADILYALKETDGDVEIAATRIAEGTISQWGEVSKPKKTTIRPKPKESIASSGIAESGSSRPLRGGRSDVRGGRGRGSERGRGSSRGRASVHPPTNGHQSKDNQQLSIPTEESIDWKTGAASDEAATNNTGTSVWGATGSTTEPTTTPAATTTTTSTTESAPAKSTVIAQNIRKTWASMLRQSTAPKPVPKPKETPAPKPTEALEPLPPVELPASEPEPQPAAEEPAKEAVELPAAAETPKVAVELEVALPPPEDDLTRVNLEQLPDASNPPATNTAASTTADSWDPRQPQPSASVTPLSASQAQHQTPRPAASGYATTAIKATERPAPRMPSYQKRLLEQEEAVRMPGNREVDRAAVQFGAFSLNGGEEDIDGDREDPETRTQPPPESPVAVPRASLPPVSQPAAVPDAFPAAQKPTASLPPAPGPAATPVAPPTGPAATTAQPPQAPANNQQFGRFGQTNVQEPAGFSQKPYDTFGQQTATTSAGLDSFPAPTTQASGPPTTGAFSSAPSEYSSYYTADPQGRNSYNNYYGQQYGQQQHGGQSHHETSNAPNRGFSGYNVGHTDNLSQYPQSGAQQTRYGAAAAAAAAADSHNSGHNTPNPIGQGGQQASGQTNQPQSNLQQQQQQYPYSHPYYSSPYYAQYMSQYNSGYGQGAYAGGPYGKGGVYGQPHQYGMSPQGPYDHGSSPATSGFGQSGTLGARESGLGSSIDNYGRAGSAQSGAPGSLGTSGFGGVHDTFGRGSAYPSQAGQSFNSPNVPVSSTVAGNDDLKPYGDTKTAGGPSPSLAAAARPGSATNTTPAGSGLPPPQSAQQGMGGYGGYPSHLSHGLHGNQTAAGSYGIGGTAGQGHGNGPYGGYGGNQAFGNYYGRQQQQGWGGNYH